MHLSYDQWGYRPESAKTLTLALGPGERAEDLPDRIPFYLNDFVQWMKRDAPLPEGWDGRYFRWPFEPAAGRIVADSGDCLHRGELRRIDSRWGVFWQGEFSDFRQAGQFHIETDFGGSFPFLIEPGLHERLQAGFINYLYHQRSGFDLPGYRRAEHLDDGVLDTNGRPVAAVGGWYNAGDMRKWLYLTLHSLDTLAAVAERGHPGLRERALDEIRWGNRYFHAMLSEAGQVWEDIGGGDLKPGLSYERDWWFENHAGCGAGGEGCHLTDNRPGTGDERKIRTHYNPFTQFMFVHWTLGHNPQGLCLHSGVGHRRPVPYSSFTAQLPDTVVVGHIGRPDDSPYLEASPLVEWSTQEIWDMPNAYLTETVLNL